MKSRDKTLLIFVLLLALFGVGLAFARDSDATSTYPKSVSQNWYKAGGTLTDGYPQSTEAITCGGMKQHDEYTLDDAFREKQYNALIAGGVLNSGDDYRYHPHNTSRVLLPPCKPPMPAPIITVKEVKAGPFCDYDTYTITTTRTEIYWHYVAATNTWEQDEPIVTVDQEIYAIDHDKECGTPTPTETVTPTVTPTPTVTVPTDTPTPTETTSEPTATETPTTRPTDTGTPTVPVTSIPPIVIPSGSNPAPTHSSPVVISSSPSTPPTTPTSSAPVKVVPKPSASQSTVKIVPVAKDVAEPYYPNSSLASTGASPWRTLWIGVIAVIAGIILLLLMQKRYDRNR